MSNKKENNIFLLSAHDREVPHEYRKRLTDNNKRANILRDNRRCKGKYTLEKSSSTNTRGEEGEEVVYAIYFFLLFKNILIGQILE